MIESTLPSPNIGSRGYHLRRVSAQSISQLEVSAQSYTGGVHPDAATLKAFFTACANACDAMITPTTAPTNTAVPTITGTPKVGVALTGANGTWTGSPTLSKQWVVGGFDVPGQTMDTYTPTALDAGKTVRLRVRGTNRGGNASAVSVLTAVVAAA